MMGRRDCGQPDKIEVDPHVLWVMAKEPNRRILRYFEESDRDPATVDDIAGYLAAQSSGRFRNDPQGAKVRLHHTSLPALDDIGIVEYEADSGVVRKPRERSLPADFKEHVFALDDD